MDPYQVSMGPYCGGSATNMRAPESVAYESHGDSHESNNRQGALKHSILRAIWLLIPIGFASVWHFHPGIWGRPRHNSSWSISGHFFVAVI